MKDRTALTRILKAIASDMKSGRLSPSVQAEMGALEASPENVFHLVDLIAEEGGKKRPKATLIAAATFLLAHSLEVLRYAVERGDKTITALVGRLCDHLLELAETGRIGPRLLMQVLNQFVSAKLDMGDALRQQMLNLMEADTGADNEAAAIGDMPMLLACMAHELGENPFTIHTMLDENAESLPENLRAAIAMAVFALPEASVREAALGFLINPSSQVRAALAELVEEAAKYGDVTPTMLRRMIAMRNWVPAADQVALDKAIKACRKKQIACAPWPQAPDVRVVASGFDGSGGHTIICVAKFGGKQSIAGLLLKQGVGVRDAWVKHGATKSEVKQMLGHVSTEIGIMASSMDYVAAAVQHFLAVNVATGTPPPFGLLEFAETVGLSDLNPRTLTAEDLVEALLRDIDPARLAPAAVAETMRDSVGWPEELPMLRSWFEDDVARFLGAKRTPIAKQSAALLAGPLQARRRRWAELLAWTAFAMKHDPANQEWPGLAIVARELIGRRPLDEIGLMCTIAETSAAVAGIQHLRKAA